MILDEFLSDWYSDSLTLLVHTSGSTGAPKPLLVEKLRMEASARLTCDFLGLKRGDTALLCMPLDFIAGKMMVVRALTCGLRLFCVEPTGHPLRKSNSCVYQLKTAVPSGLSCVAKASPLDMQEVPLHLSFAAMVPLQVYNSLQMPQERERLARIRHLIIGGGAIDDALTAELAAFPNQIWSTYGMTETLSHVALRRVNGPDASPWYTPLQGVKVSQTDDGCLVIDAPMVCHRRLVTRDVADVRADGRFRILGRKDNVVCTGGLKIQMEEVERLLQPHLNVPFCISYRPDAKYGQAMVLLAEGGNEDELMQLCRCHLPTYWQPRHVLIVPRIPLTPTGKVARAEAKLLAAQG